MKSTLKYMETKIQNHINQLMHAFCVKKKRTK